MKEVRWGEVHGGIKRYKVNKAGVLWGGIRFVRFKVFFVSITMYFLLITILKLIFWVNDFSHKNIGIRYQYLTWKFGRYLVQTKNSSCGQISNNKQVKNYSFSWQHMRSFTEFWPCLSFQNWLSSHLLRIEHLLDNLIGLDFIYTTISWCVLVVIFPNSI